MKTKTILATLLLIAGMVMLCVNGVKAQTDVPRIISYQGIIKSATGAPLYGNHKVSVAFYNNSDGTEMIWQGEYVAPVENGVFNILLGSGAYPLPSPKVMNRTIYVGVKVDGGAEMRPLSMLAGVPYAITVSDSAITKEKMAVNYLGGIALDGKTITKKGGVLNLKPGLGIDLLYDQESNTLSLNSTGGITNTTQAILDNPCSDNNDGGTGSRNVVAGGCENTANPPGGASIGYAVVGGGQSNTALGVYSVIAGGSTDTVTSVGYSAAIAGGIYNKVAEAYGSIGGGLHNSVYGQGGTIAGGSFNLDSSMSGAIGGGIGNKIDGSSVNSLIAGGDSNLVRLAFGSAIGGGTYNIVDADLAGIASGSSHHNTGENSFIGGGGSNRIGITFFNTIGGGNNNRIDSLTDFSFIGGGKNNTIKGFNSFNISDFSSNFSVLSGGLNNTVFGHTSAIVGGRNLKVGSNTFGFSTEETAINLSTDSGIAFFGGTDLWLHNDDNIARKIKFFEMNDSGSQFTSFRAGSMQSNVEYVLPLKQGGVKFVLANDGAGNLFWDNLRGDFDHNLDSLGHRVDSLVGTVAGPTDWHVTGNSGTATPTNFLGTIDSQAFEIHINNSDAVANRGSKRVMRYIPNDSSASILGGSQANDLPDSVMGGVIAGGGSFTLPNINQGDYSVISGGQGNRILSSDSGRDFFIRNSHAFIGGGFRNTITRNSDGVFDDAGGSMGATIAGGTRNTIEDNAGFIGAGDSNVISETFGVIGGGQFNRAFGNYDVIGGGFNNGCEPNHNPIAIFVGGGDNNQIGCDSVSGNPDNTVICGGSRNVVTGNHSFIGGGGGTKGAGINMFDSVLSTFSALVGGSNNTISIVSDNSFLGGGSLNKITRSLTSTLTGGKNNTISGSTSSFIGGGTDNKVLHLAQFSTIVAGQFNKIDTGTFNTIGGGSGNVIGQSQTPKLLSEFCTIPGGDHDTARGYGQTVLGYFNRPQGNSMQPTTQNRTGVIGDDRVLIIGNGHQNFVSFPGHPAVPELRSNAFEVSNNGHAIVYDSNGTGGATPGGSPRPAFIGSTYKDNIVYAWAVVKWDTTTATGGPHYVVQSDFGTQLVLRNPGVPNTGIIFVTLNTADPVTGLSRPLTDAAISVTPMDLGAEVSGNCIIANATQIGGGGLTNQFQIHLFNAGAGCIPADHSFSFQVVGR